MSSLIFDVQRFSIHDGPGIRTVVFFKGCPLACLWCQNPESISKEKEIMFLSAKCIGCNRCLEVCPRNAIDFDYEYRVRKEKCDSCGVCAENCFSQALRVVGKEFTLDELLRELLRDVPFYEDSGGGVTFSGGEPLLHPPFLVEILRKCRESGIHTCIETCGFASWSIFEKIFELTSLFLYDLKIMNPNKHKRFIGADNSLILENAIKLCQVAEVEFRMPLIPNYNDDSENILRVASFLKNVRKERIHLLPYHRLGIGKYQQLGKKYENGLLANKVSNDLIGKIKKEFSSHGIVVEVGR
jgi:pyruvate formate lyase activating enzyme